LLYSMAVGLTAVTSVLCPVMIRASIPAADWIERHLPMPVQTALSQYGDLGWRESANPLNPRTLSDTKLVRARRKSLRIRSSNVSLDIHRAGS